MTRPCTAALTLTGISILLSACSSRSVRTAVPNPPADSVEGLQLFLQGALAVARSGDEQKLASLVKEMEIPNYEAWFTSTFGPAGSGYTRGYGANLSEQDLSRQDLLEATAQRTQVVLVRKI